MIGKSKLNTLWETALSWFIICMFYNATSNPEVMYSWTENRRIIINNYITGHQNRWLWPTIWYYPASSVKGLKQNITILKQNTWKSGKIVHPHLGFQPGNTLLQCQFAHTDY